MSLAIAGRRKRWKGGRGDPCVSRAVERRGWSNASRREILTQGGNPAYFRTIQVFLENFPTGDVRKSAAAPFLS